MSLSAASLFSKSKAILERAIGYRDQGENAMFQFWAAVSLELLGKACLCHLHPAFIVDPNDFKSLRVACGNLERDDYRTIQASSLWTRLQTLVDGFDERAVTFCGRMADRRNADLHSAQVPFEGIDLRSWQNQFWKIVKVLVEAQGKTLVDLLGSTEAPAAISIIADAQAALEVAVRGRIQRCAANFVTNHSEAAAESIVELSQRESAMRERETSVSHRCPACPGTGLLTGSEIDDEFVQYLPNDYGIAVVKLFCESEDFQCMCCTLRLHGVDELAIAGLPDEFETTVEREYEFEPDYGNE